MLLWEINYSTTLTLRWSCLIININMTQLSAENFNSFLRTPSYFLYSSSMLKSTILHSSTLKIMFFNVIYFKLEYNWVEYSIIWVWKLFMLYEQLNSNKKKYFTDAFTMLIWFIIFINRNYIIGFAHRVCHFNLQVSKF